MIRATKSRINQGLTCCLVTLLLGFFGLAISSATTLAQDLNNPEEAGEVVDASSASSEMLDSRVFSPHARLSRKSLPEWSADWWRWLFAAPKTVNPALDNDGSYCAVGQHGPVWFLAGTFGDTITRSCSVSEGKPIFFPIINTACDNIDVTPPKTVRELRKWCEADMDIATKLEVELDGTPITNLTRFRFKSPVFDYALPKGHVLSPTQPPGPVFPAVADGYFIMLKPLSVGKHSLHFKGTIPDPSGDFTVDTTYNLDIVPKIRP